MKPIIKQIPSKHELLNCWNLLKIKLCSKPEPLPFKEGEVWWCNFGENIGVEINGKNGLFSRPILIFKKYNRYSFMGIPLTSQPHNGSWYVQFNFQKKHSIAVLCQAKTLSALRIYKRIGQVDETDFSRIANGFNKLFKQN